MDGESSARQAWVCVACLCACADQDSQSDSGGPSSETSAAAPSTLPSPCEGATIARGIIGRTCDEPGAPDEFPDRECHELAAEIPAAGSVFLNGSFDGENSMSRNTVLPDALFEFDLDGLPAGPWTLCTWYYGGVGSCAEPIVLTDDDPLRVVFLLRDRGPGGNEWFFADSCAQ